jgi:hypothetical protein
MALPKAVRTRIRELVWAEADQIGWVTLPDASRSRKYEEWTGHPEVGGVLGRYVDAKQVRVYLKDSVIKPYTHALESDDGRVLRTLGIQDPAPVEVHFTKPHGRRLSDGRVVCWGQARNWKAVLLAVWERARSFPDATPYSAVLVAAYGPWAEPGLRSKARDLADRLGVERLVWLDT